MSTVMEPPATFEFESPVRVVTSPSREEAVLDKMIKDAREGRWIVDALFDWRGGHCALGMVARYAYGAEDGKRMRSLWDCDPDDRIFALLNAAIPAEHWSDYGAWDRIATYNNSLASADEAVAWFERAKALA